MTTDARPTISCTAPLPPALLDVWRRDGWLRDVSVHDVLASAAAADARVVTADADVTAGEMWERAGLVAQALASAGVGAGDVVTWSLPNGRDASAVAQGIWRAGAISNPVVNIYRESEFGFIVDQLRPAAVIGDVDSSRATAATLGRALDAVGHTPRLRLCVGGPAEGWTALDDCSCDVAVPAAVLAAADPCLVLYTSGTTAKPKGVVHSSQTLLHEVATLIKGFDLAADDVVFMPSPLAHVTGLLIGILLPAVLGASVVLQDRWDPAVAVDLIERTGATFTVGAAVFLDGLVEEYQARGITSPALRQFACGGSAVDPALITAADGAGIAAFRVWGMSELPTASLSGPRDPLERRAHTDGRCSALNEVQAIDAAGSPQPAGAEGELRVRAPERMLGYVDPSMNSDIDRDGWFRTGDVGVVDADGWVTITGRVKDIVNRGGEKFSTRDIEQHLLAHPAVSDAAVFGVPGGRLGERVCAAVTLRDAADITGDALREWMLGRSVARQKVPEEIRVVDALPRTAAGKIQKFQLVSAWTN